MNADRNLLFGILALQMDFIRQEDLIDAMHAWIMAKDKALGRILADKGRLSAERLQLLEALVAEHLKGHQGDPQHSLAALSEVSSILRTLAGIQDPDVQASLAMAGTASAKVLPTTIDQTEQPDDGLRYHILRPHAAGGLGEVFVAEDGELHREVALKQIRFEHAADLQSRARFVLEAEITGGLEHPGIVPVYGLGQYADGRPFYAMRFIKGDNLMEAIRRFHKADQPGRDPGERNLAFRQLLRRFIDVCNAIAYAHSRGVLHRDLKPGNIMLGKYGETLVVDWGLAKASGEWQGTSGEREHEEEQTLRPLLGSDVVVETRQGDVIGTPAFMSPEQANGRVDQLGPASDIYSLGATLYVLLTGQSPFKDDELAGVLEKVRRGDLLPPRQVKPSTPAALAAICLKATALKPEERYDSALDLGADMEHWLADEPVSAYSEPWSVRARRWMRKHRALVSSAAAALVLALVFVAALALLIQQQKGELAKQNLVLEKANLRESGARKSAEQERDRAEGMLYAGQLKLAQAAWNENNFAAAMFHLNSTRSEYRGWEHRYLNTLFASKQQTYFGHSSRVFSVCFSPDGKRLATGGEDHTVQVWDGEKCAKLLTLSGHTGPVYCVSFSPDGKHLASAGGLMGKPAELNLWDAVTGRHIRSLTGHTAWHVWSVCFSPDSKRLASAAGNDHPFKPLQRGEVKLWDVVTGRAVLSLGGEIPWVTSVCFSPDGKRLATGSGGDQSSPEKPVEVSVWDAQTCQKIHSFREHTKRVTSVCFSPDGRRLASASLDQTVRVWDEEKSREVLILKGHNAEVRSVCFSPDGKRLATGSKDPKVWDAATGQEILTLKGHTLLVFSVAFSPDGKRLASASADRMMKVWDLSAPQMERTLKGHSGRVGSVCFSPDGKQLVTASSGALGRRGEVKVWDADTGQEVRSLKGNTNGSLSVCYSPDGKLIAGGGMGSHGIPSKGISGELKVWDAQTGQEILFLEGHTGTVNSVCFSPDGSRLASASTGGTLGRGKSGEVIVWDMKSGKEVLRLKGHTGVHASVCFAAAGNRLASAGGEYGKPMEVTVRDAETGQDVISLKGHTGAVPSLCFSPDGKHLATAGWPMKVWDAETGQELVTVKEFTDNVLCVCFSPDGKRLASGGQDNTVRLWDGVKGREVLTLKGHTEAVYSVCFSPDGSRLASASADGTIKIWEASSYGPHVF